MAFLIAALLVAPPVVALMIRYARASARYSEAVRAFAGRPAHLQDAASPRAMMQAVNADLADQDELDALVVSGQLQSPRIEALYREQRRRLRQAVIAMLMAPLFLVPLYALMQGVLGDRF